jgi:hypothetical protein
MIIFLVSKGKKKSIGDKFNILFHECGVNSEERTGETVSEKPLFDSDGFSDDILDDLFGGSFAEMGQEEAGKVSMETFVTGDEFVGECETGHEPPFFEPEDGGE